MDHKNESENRYSREKIMAAGMDTQGGVGMDVVLFPMLSGMSLVTLSPREAIDETTDGF